MEKPISSGFQFTGFYIQETLIKIKGVIGSEIEVTIMPEGAVNNIEKFFHLVLEVVIKDGDRNLECNVIARGEFTFVDEEINYDYFYVNAPAILFPYIRSYISTLTNLSTSGNPVTLPTFRLNLKETLKSNIKILA